jgi:Zn-dependent peptidase ImmA (M78 family)/transcriptional regulator with XRE-family HTH domain
MPPLDDAREIARVFDGDRLKLARNSRGWTQRQLADAVEELSSAAVSQFEKGDARPSPRTLVRLAEELSFPIRFFGHAVGTPVVEAQGFFRSLRSTPQRARTTALAHAELVRNFVLVLERYVRLPPLMIPRDPADPNTDPDDIEAIADSTRETLNVPPGPLNHAARLLEGSGAVVTRLATDDKRIDAFSVPFPDRPVVVLGSDKDNLERSRFDSAHELGHLVMHDEAACGTRWAEQQAHRFAAAFLMPADEIKGHLPTKVSWPALAELKVKWKVSMAALLLRAKTLGTIDEVTYVRGMKAMSAQGWRRKEPVDLGPCEAPALLNRSVEVAQQEGIGLAHLAGEAALPLDEVERILGRSRDPRPVVDL